MKIGIIGHFVLDELHLHDGRVHQSYGGIYFAIGAFAGITGDGETVVPVLPIGRDAGDEFLARLRSLANIDTSMIEVSTESTTRVKLFYETATSYNTCLVSQLPPITFDRLAPVLDADLMYINMMTANDIELETAEMLRAATTATLYLDTHMLAYSVAESGKRSLRPHPQWDRWCRVADVVQMNERELGAMVDSEIDEQEAVRRILNAGMPKHLVVTRGEDGATIFTKREEAIERIEIPIHPVAHVADTTGCGDSFGSAFAYAFARGETLAQCGRFAARVAACFASFHGSDGIHRLAEMLKHR